MSCGVIHRRGSEPSLLWLWYRPAAVAPIQPLAWEPPYATGAPPPPKKNQEQLTLCVCVHVCVCVCVCVCVYTHIYI